MDIVSSSRFLARPPWFALSLAAIASVLFFVWPSRYSFDSYRAGDVQIPLRTNRFTGMTDRFDPETGWRPLVGWTGPVEPREFKELPPEEAGRLTGKAEISREGLSIDLYNGSSWTVCYLTVQVAVGSSGGGESFFREYRLAPLFSGDEARALGRGRYRTRVDFVPAPGQQWEWTITGARGWK